MRNFSDKIPCIYLGPTPFKDKVLNKTDFFVSLFTVENLWGLKASWNGQIWPPHLCNICFRTFLDVCSKNNWMVIFTKKFRTLDPHLPIVWDKVLKKNFFFLTPSLRTSPVFGICLMHSFVCLLFVHCMSFVSCYFFSNFCDFLSSWVFKGAIWRKSFKFHKWHARPTDKASTWPPTYS